LRNGTYTLTIPAPANEKVGSIQVPLIGSPRLSAANVAAERTKSGWAVEIALPINLVERNQSSDWHSFQMTPILIDVDNADEDPVELIWRGTRNHATVNTNFGHFVRVK